MRKFARELGVPLAEVKGSGHKGRITQEDVHGLHQVRHGRCRANPGRRPPAPAKAAPGGGNVGGLEVLAWPKVDFAKFGPVERKELSRIKKISGANLHRNWVMIPHVTNNDLADITELEAFRVQTNAEQAKAKSDVKVTMLAFVIKAVVAALKKFPSSTPSLDGDTLVYKQYYHIGFAADTPNGLVVPVLKDADQKGISADQPGNGRAGQKGPRRQAGRGRHARRLLLHLARWAALVARTSRPSSTRPKWPSWACRKAPCSPCGTAKAVCAAPDAAAVAVVRPPRHRRRSRRTL